MKIDLVELTLPDFGRPVSEPFIPDVEYEVRIAAAREQMRRKSLDALVVYGDREHFANLAYLTGYDPRFEEALCVLTAEGKPTLIVGNEGPGYASLSPVALNVVVYQTFSLLGQPREQLVPLRKLLRAAGIASKSHVGVAGWKYFEPGELPHPRRASEVPAFILNEIRLAAWRGRVRNASALFMHPLDGLRARNSVHQLAQFEFAATVASQMVRDCIFNLQEGMSEYGAVRNMRWNGMPLSCHLMLSSGPRAHAGLASPSSRLLKRTDPFTTAVGLWGALTARAGFLVAERAELPDNVRDYVERLVVPYFEAAVNWYEALHIGVTGGELYRVVHSVLGNPFFGVRLNPGHLIHLDEWLHSPVAAGSDTALASGTALQCDIIPATGSAYFTSNVEDGVALADESLRSEFAACYPEAWTRIEARRAFMQNALGIQVQDEVLPLSDLCGYLPPYLFSPRRAMRKAG